MDLEMKDHCRTTCDEFSDPFSLTDFGSRIALFFRSLPFLLSFKQSVFDLHLNATVQ